LPGTSYARAMQGEQIVWDDVIFHEFENVRMIRNDTWKYTRRFPDGPDELYHMRNDPGERRNLADESGYISVIKDLQAQLEAFFSRHADPQYDLCRGGRSKAGRLLS
jgi:choline-sulfatase